MLIRAADHLTPLGQQWRDALAPLRVWHPNRSSGVECRLSSDDVLTVQLDSTTDTRDLVTEMRAPFVVACVKLECWPGEIVAREWFAAGFAGYCLHETLELVTFEGVAVLDPHREPYETNPANASLRHGFPPVLTDASLARAMKVVFT